MKIVGSSEVAPQEAYKVLSKREKDGLSKEAQQCLEYLRKHLTLKDEKRAEEVKGEFQAIYNFKERNLLKLLEILPEYDVVVDSLFQKERVKLTPEDVSKISAVGRALRK